jgi:hypothetical protein
MRAAKAHSPKSRFADFFPCGKDDLLEQQRAVEFSGGLSQPADAFSKGGIMPKKR